jgi:hypothetical protein
MVWLSFPSLRRRFMPQIKEETLPPSIKCRSRDACLSSKRACPCKVEEFLYDMLLFVKPPPNLECIYMLPFGDDFFCVSPMRAEIYERRAA